MKNVNKVTPYVKAQISNMASFPKIEQEIVVDIDDDDDDIEEGDFLSILLKLKAAKTAIDSTRKRY